MNAPKTTSPFHVRLDRHRGLNADAEVTSLAPGELPVATNVDLFSGGKDEIRSRRGSAPYVPGSPQNYGTGFKNETRITADGKQFLISHVGTGFYAQQLTPTPGNPTRICARFMHMDLAGGYLFEPQLTGLTLANTDNWTLYMTVENHGYGMAYVVRLYKDAAKLQEVANGNIPNDSTLPATITITEVGSSGINGSVFLFSDPGTLKSGTIGYPAWDAGTAMADIKPANDKVAAFSQAGNTVIEWLASESRFTARTMGMARPQIFSEAQNIAASGDMPPDAAYFYGVEKVFRVGGADVLSSTAHRRFSGQILPLGRQAGGGIAARLGAIPSTPGLTDDDSWNYLRIWRCKNINAVMTDPLSPIDAQGTASQMFELALISREEVFSMFGGIATGPDLPPGNAGIEIGFGVGDGPDQIYITDANDDSVLFDMITIDEMDLDPIPAARTGVVHAGMICVAGVTAAGVDRDLAEDVLYSNQHEPMYKEQWDPQAFLNAGRNSYKTTMLASFGDDLIVFRESETKRIPGGNPDAGIQMLDDKIGIASFRMAGFVPRMGFAAVCSDGYFRFLGGDLAWHTEREGLDISRAIHPYTKVSTVSALSIAYVNGKLLMLLVNVDGQVDHGLFALHVQERRGWTKYEYRVSNLVALFAFGATRAAVLPAASRLVEIELETDTDTDGTALHPVAGKVEFAPIVADENMMLDVWRFKFWGRLTRSATCVARSSGQLWDTEPAFQAPELWAMTPALNEREYEFIPKPQDIGPFQWVPLRGRFVSVTIETLGEFFLTWYSAGGVQRSAAAGQSVFPDAGIVPSGPGWAQASLMLLNFEDPASEFQDATGRGHSYSWGGSGTKTNRVTQLPGKGLQIAGGYVVRQADAVAPLLGESPITWKFVFSYSSGNIEITGRAGGKWYRIRTVTGSSGRLLVYVSDGTTTWQHDAPYAFTSGVTYAVTVTLSVGMRVRVYVAPVAATRFPGALAVTPVQNFVVHTPGIPGPSPYLRDLNIISPHSGGAWYVVYENAGGVTTVTLRIYSSVVAYGSTAGPLPARVPLAEYSGSQVTAAVTLIDLGAPEVYHIVYDVTDAPPEGARITASGTSIISYFEVLPVELEAEQAERFWGILEVY